MKMRHFSFFSLATACVFLTGGAALLGGSGCSSTSNTTGTVGTTGGGGSGGSGAAPVLDPANKISDFEDLAAATVVMAGTPARNGYWYTYNDDNPKGGLDLLPGAAVRTSARAPRGDDRALVVSRGAWDAGTLRRDRRRIRAARDVDGLQRVGRRHRR